MESWKSAERLSMEERGEHLHIFDVKQKKAPTLAQVTLQLTERKGGSNDAAKMVDWISDGIKAQSDQ